MKVKVSFTIEVDEKEWAETYGCDKSEVRQDVKNYIYYGVEIFSALSA